MIRNSRLKPGQPLRRVPLAKVGRRARRNLSADNAWELAVKVRDKFLCQRCKRKTLYVEAHHIHSKQARPDLRHDLRNGVTLCVAAPGFGGCHYNYAHHDVAEARVFFLSLPSAERLSQICGNDSNFL